MSDKSMFHRKHYQFIAEVIKFAQRVDPKADTSAVSAAFMQKLKVDNPNFDEARFMQALMAKEKS
jgi:hypothetical protein